MPFDTRSQPSPIAARIGAGSDKCLDHILDRIDGQRIMVAVELDDRRFVKLAVVEVGGAKFQRALAIDHRQHAAAQRRQAGEMVRRARDRDQRIELDDAFDAAAGKATRLPAMETISSNSFISASPRLPT